MSRLAALLALTAVAAQMPPSPPPGMRQVRIDVSPAGQAVLKKYLGTPDPAVKQRLDQLRAVAAQIGALADAPKLDLARLHALLRQQESIKTALQQRGDDRMLAMLGELSEADRLKFVRSLRAGPTVTKPPAGK